MNLEEMELTEKAKAPRIYKVSEITREIKFLLEDRFKTIWIEGEVSNFKHHSSGHMYFTLKDANAQIKACFFRGQNQSLKFELKDGLHIICIGQISVYPPQGSYQVYVERVEPKGVGALQLAFLQLKERLEKEGLFDEARKRPIPIYPKMIGIVTSPTGAAIQDILKVFKRCKAAFQVLVIPVRVQGDGAAREIVQAIQEFNRRGDTDVLIVGRGGGSLEDLWAFNEEIVARAIFKSKIPVVSAVGHEIDWTISDFVADHRAHTPTAAAELLIFHWDELHAKLRQLGERIQNAMQAIWKGKSEQLENLQSSYAFRQPKTYLRHAAQRVDELLRQLSNYVRSGLEQKRSEFQNLAGKLHVLSPLAGLGRGYTITFDAKGHALRSVKSVSPGVKLKTKFQDGMVESEVKNIEQNGEDHGK